MDQIRTIVDQWSMLAKFGINNEEERDRKDKDNKGVTVYLPNLDNIQSFKQYLSRLLRLLKLCDIRMALNGNYSNKAEKDECL